MASQTLICSSTPNLATFNNFRTIPPPLLVLPSPRAFNNSSSLPTLSLKAFNFGVKPLQTSDFKCYATVTDEKDIITSVDHKHGLVDGWKIIDIGPVRVWKDIKDVAHNEHVQALGQLAVDEENKKPENAKTPIRCLRVVAEELLLVAGVNYRLWIEGEVDKVFKAFVFVGLPVYPKALQSFKPVPWTI